MSILVNDLPSGAVEKSSRVPSAYRDDAGRTFWEASFVEKKEMWGEKAALSTNLALELLTAKWGGVFNDKRILVPGAGYGRNAKVFVEAGATVAGVEISRSAIDLACANYGAVLVEPTPTAIVNPPFPFVLYHASATEMRPLFSTGGTSLFQFDAIFCYALVHLLNAADRQRVIADSFDALVPGGVMVFTVVTKNAPNYGQGTQVGTDCFEMYGGVRIFFYDEESVRREFAPFGLVEVREVAETLPFYFVVCAK